MEREHLGSRIGFLFLAASCSIGLGNVWRFPYVTGAHGGAIFVLLYIGCLLLMGIPILTMEFAVGRGSQRSVARAFHEMQPAGASWHIWSYFSILGNYLLMMFYTVLAGWVGAYLFFMIRGDFVGATPDQVGGIFGGLITNPALSIGWMVATCVFCFAICAMGLRKGVERSTKIMMGSLFIIMIVLAGRALTLPGGMEGVWFLFRPNPAAVAEIGLGRTIYAAMGQAFFSLSVGIGSMAIFGSYINKERRLMGEAVTVASLDTTCAILAGLIVFPACFAFGVEPSAGPGLLFVSLPNVFNSMPFGQLWGIVFFVFMVFASWSTVIAVFENIIAMNMEIFGFSRKKASAINAVLVPILAVPCALSFNVLAGGGFGPFTGDGWVLDLEDFILSNNLLPLGALIFLMFCVTKYGWGWNKFIEEANAGEGMKFPTGNAMRIYFSYILPIIILVIFAVGYMDFFG